MTGRTPKDYNIKDHEEFLKEFRYILVNIISVEKCISWMRGFASDGLDEVDQDDILNRYTTRVCKVGNLIDKLLRKGKKTFFAFLEYVEYEHPEHFQKFTKLPATQRPEDFFPDRPDRPRPSSALLKDLLERFLINERSASQLKENLNTIVVQVQEQEQDLAMKDGQIDELSQKILEMKDQSKDLYAQREDDRRDMATKDKKINELVNEQDEYREKCMKLMTENEKQGGIARASMKQNSVRDQTRSRLQQEVTELRRENEMLKSGRSSKSGEELINEEIKRQKHEIDKLVEDKDKIAEEKEFIEDKCEKLSQYCQNFETNCKEYKEDLDRMKKERDYTLNELEKYRQKCDDFEKINNNLKDEISAKKSRVRQLELETDSQHFVIPRQRLDPVSRQIQPTSPIHVQLQKLEAGFVPYPQGDHVHHSGADHAHADTNDQYAIIDHRVDMIPTVSSSDDNDEISAKHCPSLKHRQRKSYERCTCRQDPRAQKSATLPRAEAESSGNKNLNRRAMIQHEFDEGQQAGAGHHHHHRRQKGKKKRPLALFAPEKIAHTLTKHMLALNGTFKSCPEEMLQIQQRNILDEWLGAGKCVHYREAQNCFHCVCTQTLKEHMQREDCGRILLTVPVDALKRMVTQGIHPIICVVKYKEAEDRGRKSGAEEELDKHRMEYEKIIVDTSVPIDNIVQNIKIKCAATESATRVDLKNCNPGPIERITSTTSI